MAIQLCRSICKAKKIICVLQVTCSKKIRVVRQVGFLINLFNYLSSFFFLYKERMEAKSNQNLLKFKYTQVIKPSRTH